MIERGLRGGNRAAIGLAWAWAWVWWGRGWVGPCCQILMYHICLSAAALARDQARRGCPQGSLRVVPS